MAKSRKSQTVNRQLHKMLVLISSTEKLVALLQLYYCCHVVISVMCLFLAVHWVGMHSVIVAFSGQRQLLFSVQL